MVKNLLLSISILALGGSSAFAQERKPNLIVILAEDIGLGDLGCFGQKTLKTPRLDDMAKEGMRFTQFYAGHSVCSPSRYTLLTGKHTGKAFIRGESEKSLAIPSTETTVASLLKGAGYTTACIGKWGVGAPEFPENPNEVGFDHFYGFVNAGHARKAYPDYLIRNGKPALLKNKTEKNIRADYAPDRIVDDALAFIRANETKPFFLLLSLPVPYGKEKGKAIDVPDLGEFANADWPEAEKAFAGMVRNLDRDTGKILDLLKQLKIERNTLVIFTSANGPNSEGGHRPEFFQSTGRHRGGKGDPHEGGIRVPTIAWWPGTVKAGSEDILQWYAGDLIATAAEIAGVKVPVGVDSDSLVPALRGQAGEDRWRRRSPLYWESYAGPGWQIVRFGKWKAIRSPLFTGEILLYDMSNDPAEKHNYAIRRPDLANHANNLLKKHHQPDPNWKVTAP